MDRSAGRLAFPRLAHRRAGAADNFVAEPSAVVIAGYRCPLLSPLSTQSAAASPASASYRRRRPSRRDAPAIGDRALLRGLVHRRPVAPHPVGHGLAD